MTAEALGVRGIVEGLAGEGSVWTPPVLPIRVCAVVVPLAVLGLVWSHNAGRLGPFERR
jgi:hypothetical protein